MIFIAKKTIGARWIRTPRPSATTMIWRPTPIAFPRTDKTARRVPKTSALPIANKTLGPGTMMITKAKTKKPSKFEVEGN